MKKNIITPQSMTRREWYMTLDPEDAKEAIEGSDEQSLNEKCDSLYYALCDGSVGKSFNFNFSPKGYNYWDKIATAAWEKESANKN